MSERAAIYTDGSCFQSAKQGGWAAVIISERETRVISGAEETADNYRMELKAVLEAVKAADGPFTLICDHAGIVSCLHRRIRPKTNRDLWTQIYAALDSCPWHRSIAWEKGESSAGHRQAHDSAREAARGMDCSF